MFAKMELRACPRCHGEMAFREDLDGPYWTCLRCSRPLYPAAPPPLALRLTHAILERSR